MVLSKHVQTVDKEILSFAHRRLNVDSIKCIVKTQNRNNCSRVQLNVSHTCDVVQSTSNYDNGKVSRTFRKNVVSRPRVQRLIPDIQMHNRSMYSIVDKRDASRIR